MTDRPPTDDKLDLLIEIFEASDYMEPWLRHWSQAQKRERLLEWLASEKRAVRVKCGRMKERA